MERICFLAEGALYARVRKGLSVLANMEPLFCRIEFLRDACAHTCGVVSGNYWFLLVSFLP
jgi:hypothetical protein